MIGLRAALIGLLCFAPSAVLASAGVDQLNCYRINDPLKLRGIVDIDSKAFGLEPGCKIKKPVLFCVPASSNVREAREGRVPIEPLNIDGQQLADDRICYKIECKKPFPPDQEVTDQFGSRTVRKLKPFLVCGPAVRGGLPTTTSTTTSTTTTLPGACPTRLQLTVNGSHSDFDRGWTGLAHDQHFPSGDFLTLGISCPRSKRSCGQCDAYGPLADADGTAGRRCTSDTARHCLADSDCAALGGTCEYALGHPLPVSSGGVPVCLQGYTDEPISGTVNLDEGSLLLRLPSASWESFIGIVSSQPCPICENDPVQADGKREGTCDGGENDGDPCDAGAMPSNLRFGPTSLDCPPQLGFDIGTITTGAITFSTGTQAVTLSRQSPDCGPLAPRLKCFCSTCSTPAAQPCFSGAECPSGSTCGGKRCLGGEAAGTPCDLGKDCDSGRCGRAGALTKPNSCFDPATGCLFNAADTDSVDEGTCADGPVDHFCSADDYLGCAIDADCNPPPAGTCPDCVDGQTCLPRPRQCYTDNGELGGTVQVAGSSSPHADGTWVATLGALFCMSPTNSDSADTVIGLPGLGRINMAITATELP